MIRMFDSNDPVMGFVYSTWIKVQSDIKDAYDPNLLRSDATRFDADSCVCVRAKRHNNDPFCSKALH